MKEEKGKGRKKGGNELAKKEPAETGTRYLINLCCAVRSDYIL
jgi:hypothetical protein